MEQNRSFSVYAGVANEEELQAIWKEYTDALSATFRDALDSIAEICNFFAKAVRTILDGAFKLILSCFWRTKWFKEYRRILRRSHLLIQPTPHYNPIHRVRLQNAVKHLPESIAVRFL